MTGIRSITVQLDTDKACEARLTYALAVAEQFGADVHGIFAKGQPAYYATIDAFATGDLMELYNRAMDEAAATVGELFHRVAGGRDRVSMESVDRPWDEALADRAHMSDLLIVAQPDSKDSASTARMGVAGNAVMSAGVPVLFVPYIGASAEPPKTVVIAWKESREATRAVRDALPFLAGAKVLIMTVAQDAKSPNPSADKLVAYLKLHGVAAEHAPALAGGLSVGDLILSRISDFGADLLVMGGYSHHRWRETILGGVTRTILGHMTVPVLMSH